MVLTGEKVTSHTDILTTHTEIPAMRETTVSPMIMAIAILVDSDKPSEMSGLSFPFSSTLSTCQNILLSDHALNAKQPPKNVIN